MNVVIELITEVTEYLSSLSTVKLPLLFIQYFDGCTTFSPQLNRSELYFYQYAFIDIYFTLSIITQYYFFLSKCFSLGQQELF